MPQATLNTDDTIVAAATPPGRGGVAIVRVSGPNVPKLLKYCLPISQPQPRHAYYVGLRDHSDHLIDEGLLIWFAAPESYTGEEVLEFQGHGNPVLVNAVIQYFIDQGCEHAPPGGFTHRAFINGKIDLLQAEAVADLINADHQLAARAAMRSLQGEFSSMVQDLESELLNVRMHVEAAIDFSDEDIDFESSTTLKQHISTLHDQIHTILQKAETGHVVHQGLTAMIIGPPNVGKSSLFNALCQEEAAIVTDYAGTTRDILEREIIFNHIPFKLLDTAGIHLTDEPIEQVGIQRAIEAIESADLILCMGDATQHTLEDLKSFWTHSIGPNCPTDRICWLFNKSDLSSTLSQTTQQGIHISAKNRDKLDDLATQALRTIGLEHNQLQTMIPARKRHLYALEQTAQHLAQALGAFDQQGLEIVAEHLKIAHQTLTALHGNADHEHVLSAIFSSFCIGK